MPKRPSQAEREEVQLLVQWLYAKSGSPSWSRFVQDIGVLSSQMSDWSTGKNAPSSYNLVKMMRAAGVIASAESVEAVPDFREASVGRHLEELEEKVDDQGKQVTRALGFLARDLRRLERRLAGGGLPAIGDGQG